MRRYHSPKLEVVRTMRMLASKFCPGDEGTVHVVDPQVDLRYRFEDEICLQQMLSARGLNVMVSNIKRDYLRWWDAYRQFVESTEEGVDRKFLRKVLLSECEGLISALKLPNDVEANTLKEDYKNNYDTVLQTSSQNVCCRNRSPYEEDKGTYFLQKNYSNTLVRYAVQELLLRSFGESYMRVSPPHMVRGAIVEAVNAPLEIYPSFTDNSKIFPTTFLAGTELASLIAIFTNTRFIHKSNQWPISLICAGTSYRKRNISAVCNKPCQSFVSQCQKVLLLSISMNEIDDLNACSMIVAKIMHIFSLLEIKVRDILLPCNRLFFHESAATAFFHYEKELARVSRSGQYISRRVNMVVDHGKTNSEFVHLTCAEINVSSVADVLLERNPDVSQLPKSLWLVL